MFFDRLNEVCAARRTSPSAAAIAIGRSKSNVTGWRNGQMPGGDTIIKLADLLNVPADFLLERPPFDCWEAINQDRAGFLQATGLEDTDLDLTWGIDLRKPEEAPLPDFLRFVAHDIASASKGESGLWQVKLTDSTRKPQKETAPEPMSDAGLKFALFGDAEIDDAVLDEVKRFAQFAKEQKKERRRDSD